MFRLKLTLILTSLLVLFMVIPGLAAGDDVASNSPLGGAFVANQIIIGINPQTLHQVNFNDSISHWTGITSVDKLNEKYAVNGISQVFEGAPRIDPHVAGNGLGGVFLLTVPLGTDIFAMLVDYETAPAIEFAEPNRIYRINDIPGDTYFGKQWALHNTGQTKGQYDADIDAPEAWDIEQGNSSVMIAIIDTGVDYNHPDLKGNKVRADLDKDFVNGDDNAMDDHGHGTYTAGIATANTNNKRGIAGVCPNCRILPVKVLDSEGSGTAVTVANGIHYAASKHAQVISMSLGYASDCGCSETVTRAINYAYDKGSLLIAASGNDSDKRRVSYPASSPRVLSVGATNHKDHETDFSNYDGYLDIFAPGEDVYSLDLNGGYREASGTSAAAPHVSGTAGLVLSKYPRLSNDALWWVLKYSADQVSVPGNTSRNTVHQTSSVAALPYKMYLPGIPSSKFRIGRLNSHSALTIAHMKGHQAAVDRCNGEPQCAPGCAAEVVLVGSESVIDDLRQLRTFRDTLLVDGTIGEPWAVAYQQHRLEVATILARDRRLRGQALASLDNWLPLISAIVDPERKGRAILTLQHIEDAEQAVSGISIFSSDQLKSDLERESWIFEELRSHIGEDVRDIWHELNRRYAD